MRPVPPRHHRVRRLPGRDHRRLHRRRLLRPDRPDRIGQVDRDRRHDLRPVRLGTALGSGERHPVRAGADRQPLHRPAGLRRRRSALRRRPGGAPVRQVDHPAEPAAGALPRPDRHRRPGGRRADRVAGRRPPRGPPAGVRAAGAGLRGLLHLCRAAAGRLRHLPAGQRRRAAEHPAQAARRPALRVDRPDGRQASHRGQCPDRRPARTADLLRRRHRGRRAGRPGQGSHPRCPARHGRHRDRRPGGAGQTPSRGRSPSRSAGGQTSPPSTPSSRPTAWRSCSAPSLPPTRAIDSPAPPPARRTRHSVSQKRRSLPGLARVRWRKPCAGTENEPRDAGPCSGARRRGRDDRQRADQPPARPPRPRSAGSTQCRADHERCRVGHDRVDGRDHPAPRSDRGAAVGDRAGRHGRPGQRRHRGRRGDRARPTATRHRRDGGRRVRRGGLGAARA